jgi:hypothetical protein
MARQVPYFRVTLDENATYQDMVQNPQIRGVVMSEVVNAIKDGIKKKKRDRETLL